MIPLLFVGDGDRDGVVVPALVQGILKSDVRPFPYVWTRLHQSDPAALRSLGKGYKKKLGFSILLAKRHRALGVIATVDRDKDRKGNRLDSLRQQRDDARTRGELPIAIGEAIPHGEAWLLDDPVAVRQSLYLGGEHVVPSVRDTEPPKIGLERLLGESRRSCEMPLDVWRDIAGKVDPKRCRHSDETGFKAFYKDVRAEIGPLVAARKPKE